MLIAMQDAERFEKRRAIRTVGTQERKEESAQL